MINRQFPFLSVRCMYPFSVSCLICLFTAFILMPTSFDSLGMVMSGNSYIKLSILLVVSVRNKIHMIII